MKESELPLIEQAEAFREKEHDLRTELGTVIVGQEETLSILACAVFADGHVLLEGLPGLGKTLMVKSLAQSLSLEFNRVQFTPDLMPADITGTTVISESSSRQVSYTFEPGPLFTNLLLADEINRAGPKTQSALLQAMQEREVSLFGKHYPLDSPFLVVATQNPIELAGTYPLPEAQLDRFLFKVNVTPPSEEEMLEIAERTTGSREHEVKVVLQKEDILSFRKLIRQIPVAEPVLRKATRAVLATRPEGPSAPPLVRKLVRYGASPRGLQSLLLSAKVRACREGRFNVSLDDIRAYWLPCLRHRIILDTAASVEGITTDDILQDLLPILDA